MTAYESTDGLWLCLLKPEIYEPSLSRASVEMAVISKTIKPERKVPTLDSLKIFNRYYC
jgi:hypothetical protein